jgi:mannose/cellobiose epimerase-like protein (N-acyl-D-glucosamine 2-epimerase family)
MKRLFAGSLLTVLTCFATFACREKYVVGPGPVPVGERWISHLEKDLIPFWTMESALGKPVGNFPTFRCDDGNLPDPELPCAELAYSGAWISQKADREYTRMKSRQIYFYGAAYHLTGDEKMLELARAGVEYLRQNAIEKDTGSAITYWKDGRPGPRLLARTTQDLAYAELGMSFYYYLTRDPEVLADILRLKKHIFETFYDERWGMLRWTREGVATEVQRQELVSQLDQINAYMLLLAPILPEPHQSEWKNDLVRLARLIKDRFFAPEHGMFWGSLHLSDDRVLGSHHTDFGHTIKSFWMIERTGRLTGQKDLVDFARRDAPRVFEKAFMPDNGCWASGLRRDGSLDVWLSWWTFAELDQMAATLSLEDRTYTGYLGKTSECWFKFLVDHESHEVWGSASPYDPSRKGGKVHLWKNGYHSAEHALVMYLTGQEFHGKPARLFFAFPAGQEGPVVPYFFSGESHAVKREPLTSFGRDRVEVSFSKIR